MFLIRPPVASLVHVLGIVDFVLLMAVEPGYSGQVFIESTYENIAVKLYKEDKNIVLKLK